MGRIVKPDATGHTVIEWDVSDPPSVEKANEEFDRIIAASGLITKPTGPGKSEQVTHFDPVVEEYRVISPMQGG